MKRRECMGQRRDQANGHASPRGAACARLGPSINQAAQSRRTSARALRLSVKSVTLRLQ